MFKAVNRPLKTRYFIDFGVTDNTNCCYFKKETYHFSMFARAWDRVPSIPVVEDVFPGGEKGMGRRRKEKEREFICGEKSMHPMN